MIRTRRATLGLLSGAVFAASGLGTAAAQPRPGRQGPPGADAEMFEGMPMIDTHAHLVFRRGDMAGLTSAADAAIAAMDRLNISRTLVLPPPQPDSFANGYDLDDFLSAIRRHPQRLGFQAGGGSLNPILDRHARARDVPAAAMQVFEAAAVKIANAGAAGFGEMTAEHLSFEANHPYETARPDHPLLLRLADIAADRGLPIDLHMEALPSDMALPPPFASRSSLNPAKLTANIDRFERLLEHNRRARIVWVHAGWDNTGERTPALMRRLLRVHANLFMSIKIVGPPAGQPNHPFAEGRQVKPDWLALLRDFPDRFVIGTDGFHAGAAAAGRRPPANPATRLFVNALPADLAAKIASINATVIYRLAA